jgi:hypothetical protein
MDWWTDLLTTYIHHSELQPITALSLISMLYKSPQQPLSPFPACCVFNSHSLATASNSGDSSASHAQGLSSELNSQLTTNYVPGWQPFHTNLLVFSSQTDFQLNWTALHCTALSGVFTTWPWGGSNRKHYLQQSFYCCHGRLLSNISDTVDVFIGCYQARHVPSHECCIATVLYITILLWFMVSLFKFWSEFHI